jgi:hypothetical protein
MRIIKVVFFIALILLITNPVFSQSKGSWGIRGGIGTDISGGIAFGGGVNYMFPSATNWTEIGPVFYISNSTETSDNGFNTYEEETNLTVFGVLANLLINYNALSSGGFFLVGAGAAAISVEWEERSDTDTSLGEPYGSGSKQSEDGTAGGLVLNFGAGYKFEGQVDIRAELPIIIIAGAPGEVSSVVPTLTATVGIRF